MSLSPLDLLPSAGLAVDCKDDVLITSCKLVSEGGSSISRVKSSSSSSSLRTFLCITAGERLRLLGFDEPGEGDRLRFCLVPPALLDFFLSKPILASAQWVIRGFREHYRANRKYLASKYRTIPASSTNKLQEISTKQHLSLQYNTPTSDE
uniref:Uncharacterized protein n=1 Tax=Glossina pallidipes TaxID=7398 RepID=A0A1B0AJA4_GLOPL